MIQKIDDLKLVEVGTLGDITTTAMIRIHVWQGVNTGKFFGVIIDHCRSGDDQKPRTIMFSDLDRLGKISEAFSDKQEPSRSL